MTALSTILRETSPIPMGLTPGHLFRAMRQQTTKADTLLADTLLSANSTFNAKVLQRSREACWNEQHTRRQAVESNPDRSAAPWHQIAACLMKSPSRLSKMMLLNGKQNLSS